MKQSTKYTPSHSLLDYFNEIVVGFSTTGEILFKNTAFNNLTAYSELVRNINEFSHGTEAFLGELQDILKNQTEVQKKINIKLDGQSFVLEGRIAPYSSPEYTNCYIAILQDITHKHIENRIRESYYAIGNLSKNSSSLEELLEQIHELLKREIGANNLIVCLQEKDNSTLSFPYISDEEIGGKQEAYSREKQKGLTEYVFETQKAHLLYEEDIFILIEKNEVIPTGEIPKVWLGVPLLYDDEQVGVIAVKSHSNSNKFNQSHLELLEFISLQIGFVVERQKQEDKIKAQSAVLESIIESGNHLIWSVDRERKLTSFNSSYAEAIKKIHGKNPSSDPDQANRLLLSDKKFEALISEKYDLAFKGFSQNYETSFEDGNGKITWREMFLSPIYSNYGEINEISGIAHDITNKKKVELDLIENEQKFRGIFESFQDIYIKLDYKNKIETVSPSATEILGYDIEELKNRSVDHFFEEHKTGDLDKLTYLIETNGLVKNFELKIIKKNGRRIPCLINFKAVTKNNTVIGLEGVIRDISEIQRITDELKLAKREAENSLKIKESFLANMSHEIRTPMNGIIATVELLTESKLSRKQRENVDTLRQSSNILLNILNDILDLSKLEAGKMQARKEPVSVKDVLQQTYLLFSQSAKQKKIDYNFFIDPSIPKKIISDETRLVQVLSNLVSNAIKFTGNKGSVSILTSCKILARNTYITFEVKDSGIGISKENIKNLFVSFNQLDSSIGKQYGGTGLGLSISNELCKILGGEIKVESKLGKGSSFKFTLKTKVAKDLVKNSPKDIVTNKNKQSIKGMNVLLVDDMEVNRRVGTKLLESLGVETQVASNGSEALGLVNIHKYDVVLMDIQMPVMDGVTALENMKNLSNIANTKIIAMTAYSMEEDRDRFLKNGFHNYISKPITKGKILEAILEEPIISVNEEQEFFDSIFNLEQVNSIKEIGGEEMFMDLLHDFNHEARDLLNEIKVNLEEINMASLLEISHSLKGSAGSIGLQKIYTCCHEIETAIRKKKQADFKSLTKEVFKEYESFVNWLKSKEETS